MSAVSLDSLSLATQFQADGYVVLEDAIDPAAIAALRSAAAQLVDDFDIDNNRTTFSTDDRDAGRDEYFFASAEQASCFLEAGAIDETGALVRDKSLAINKIGHAMHDLDPAFEAFCRQPVFGEALRAVGYNIPSLFQTMYIFKQPGIGGEVRWHQDASYLIAGGRGVTGVWVALEDADKENGCLWMQPGQHRSPLREIYEVDWQSRAGVLRTLDDTPWRQDGIDAVPLEVKAGSVGLFSDHMPHYSSENRSPRSRHAFTMHVKEQSDAWDDKNWLQRPNLGEFLL